MNKRVKLKKYFEYVLIFISTYAFLTFFYPMALESFKSTQRAGFIPLILFLLFLYGFAKFFTSNRSLSETHNNKDLERHFRFADVISNIFFVFFVLASFLDVVDLGKRGINVEMFSVIVSSLIIFFVTYQVANMEIKKGLRFEDAVALGATTISFGFLIIGVTLLLLINSSTSFVTVNEYFLRLINNLFLVTLPVAYIAKSDILLRKSVANIWSYLLLNFIYVIILINVSNGSISIIYGSILRIAYFMLLEFLSRNDIRKYLQNEVSKQN